MEQSLSTPNEPGGAHDNAVQQNKLDDPQNAGTKPTPGKILSAIFNGLGIGLLLGS